MSYGQADLEAMVSDGDLEACPADAAGARALLTRARRHVETARSLIDDDTEIAADALHAGNRKALEAVLLDRGLRSTKKGGHIAPRRAVQSMLGGGRGLLGVYDVVRRLRHEGDYTLTDLHPDDVRDNLQDSLALVDACEKVVGMMPPFSAGRARS